MPGLISRSTIFAAIKKGVKKAQRDYRNMSRDKDGWAIPESYFQSKIADALDNMNGSYHITLEDSYDKILGRIGTEKITSKKLEKTQERADIVIWRADGQPRLIVEIKRVKTGRGLAKDAKKIRDALNSESQLQGGILIGIFLSPEKDIEGKAQEFEKRKGINPHKEDFVKWKQGKNKAGEAVYAGAGIYYIK